MKNLNILLAAAMTLTLSTAIFAAKKAVVLVTAAELALDKVRTEKANSLKQAALDKNPKCKFSPNKKFFAVMTRNENDRGTSITVYNLDKNEAVIVVTPETTTIRDFKLTDTTLVVKYRNKSLKSVTYTLEVQCKKCKRILDENCTDCGQTRIGMVAKARAFGFVPAPKK